MLGWDVGGVNTKVACVRDGIVDARVRAYELQRDPAALVPLLRDMAAELTAGSAGVHAVTMTAELSQMFRTKREGVSFVLSALEQAFPGAELHVWTADGRFLSPPDARRDALAVAAANWSATARAVAAIHRDALLVDVGTTTTDLIPIVGGEVVARGWTDPDRLASGELVYTGALRTPVEAVVAQVPYGAGAARVSAEGFALVGDVHVWRGDLDPRDYSVPPPDGRPASRQYCGERLARVVCADREMLDERSISRIADAVALAQVDSIVAAMGQVLRRQPSLRTAVVTGLGAFLGGTAARAHGLEVVDLSGTIGAAAARCAPAAAVAMLLAARSGGCSDPLKLARAGTIAAGPSARHRNEYGHHRRGSLGMCDVVVKVGGGLLARVADLDHVLAAVTMLARSRRVLIVAGGGTFADAVRDVDRRIGIPADAAHWMAILAMDQYAHLLASRLTRGVVVRSLVEAAEAIAAARLPVLAPSRWLAEADPLPHSWDVTSDSIAAWVAGEAGARDLLLVKPAGATGLLVDRGFYSVVPAGVTPVIVPAEQTRSVLAHLSGRTPAAES